MAPVTPPPPGILVTTRGWSQCSLQTASTALARRSDAPPAENGTTSSTCCSGTQAEGSPSGLSDPGAADSGAADSGAELSGAADSVVPPQAASARIITSARTALRMDFAFFIWGLLFIGFAGISAALPAQRNIYLIKLQLILHKIKAEKYQPGIKKTQDNKKRGGDLTSPPKLCAN